MNGALVIDKPEGVTSHDVVASVRRLLGVRRIGHLGTLDPFSTGVMVLLVGSATRLARFFLDREKTYQGVIRFGYSTDTMDCTGTPLSERTSPSMEATALRDVAAEFVGGHLQRPPAYSAKKVDGIPAYRLARKGAAVDLKPVPVTIHELDLQWIEGSRAGFTVRVSSGTYIRSLVNDIGERLGVGAHLEQLRRTSLGEFDQRDALKLETLAICLEHSQPVLIPAEDLLPQLPMATLTAAEAALVERGRPVELSAEGEWLRLMSPGKTLVAMGHKLANNLYHPEIVLVNSLGQAAEPKKNSPQEHLTPGTP
jgi:tRNA pseudouridine55 synthase